MLVRGGSPANGAASGLSGVKAENTESKKVFFWPSWDGLIGRLASSASGPAGPPLRAAARPRSSSSGRKGLASSMTDPSAEALSLARSAAVACLRRLATSGSFGQAGLAATAEPSGCGGGRLRLGGTTSGARSRYSIPSPSRFKPRSFMNCRNSLVSSGTSSSSSAFWAKALPALHASASASARVPATAARAGSGFLGYRSGMNYPLQAAAKCAASPRSFSSRSGRFCGAPRQQGLVQQPDHPGHDGHVRQVENVPFEAETGGGEVKQYEIGHCPIGKPVDGVADRPADDQAQRHRGQARGRPRQPNPQQHDGNRLQRQQRPLPERPVLLEQAVADALVPGQHQIEERGQRHDAARPEIDDEQQPELERLIGDGADERHGEAETGERAPQQGWRPNRVRAHEGHFHSAALRIASHSRSALASRRDTSG